MYIQSNYKLLLKFKQSSWWSVNRQSMDKKSTTTLFT